MHLPTTLPRPWRRPGAAWLLLPPALAAAVALGVLLAQSPVLAMLVCALALVAACSRAVNLLAVVMFLTLPYMSVNMPTGAFNLKVCDVGAYLFAAAWLVRTALRHERIAAPPATVPVLVFLACLCVSALLSAPVPVPYLGDVVRESRNGPDYRPISVILWLGLSWLVVVALYNTAGARPALFRRCLRAHILGSGLACVISLGMYALGLLGYQFYDRATGHQLVFDMGNYLRLAGVAYEPLFLGFYLITVIPITIMARLFHPDWLPGRLTGPILALQLLTLLLTFSAGGWAALAVSLVIILPTVYPRLSGPSRRRLWAGLVVVSVLTVAVCVIVPKAADIVNSPLQKIAQGTDNVRRTEWDAGRRIFADHPVFGVGPGLSRFIFAQYDWHRSPPLGLDIEVSNLYLSLLAEDGVVGMAAFVWCGLAGAAALALVVRRWGAARVPLLTALLASLVGCALQFTSFNALHVVYFPAAIGLAVAAARLAPVMGLPETEAGRPAARPAPAALVESAR